MALEVFSLLAYILILEDSTRCLTKYIDCYFLKNVSAMYLVTTISSSNTTKSTINNDNNNNNTSNNLKCRNYTMERVIG